MLGKKTVIRVALVTFALLIETTFAASLASAADPGSAKKSTANRSPASLASASRGPGSQDIEKELKVTGQSRNLSMGLLFQKDKDKLSFGSPRTNYKDKIVEKSSNF